MFLPILNTMILGCLIKKTDHKGELISSYKYSNNL